MEKTINVGIVFGENVLVVNKELYKYFEAAGYEHKIKAGEYIRTHQGEDTKIYLVKSGVLWPRYVNEYGKELSYHALGAGEIIAMKSFSEDDECSVNLYAYTDVVLIACEIKELLPYMQKDDALNKCIIDILIHNSKKLVRQLNALTLYDSRKRLANFLFMLTTEEHTNKGYKLNSITLTHEELSIRLNLSRVTITKLLNEFADQGLIEIGYGKISVKDCQGLLSIFEEK